MIKTKLYQLVATIIKRFKNCFVPVIWCTREDKENGLAPTVLFIGWDRKLQYYWFERLFNKSDFSAKRKLIPGANISRYLKKNENLCDVAIVETSKIEDRINQFRPYLILPRWMEMTIDIEPSLKKSWSKEVRRKIRKYSLDYEFRDTKKDFDLFHDKMYKPLIKNRHGDSAEIANYDLFLNKILNKQAQLLFIIKDNEPVAGQFIEKVAGTFRINTFGIVDGSQKIQKMGVHAALYFFALTHFGKLGHKSIRCGSSMPLVFDGVTQFKMRMGAKPYLKDLKSRSKYIFLPINNVLSIKKVLNNNPVFYLENEKLNIAYFHYPNEFSDKKDFLQKYKQINCENIDKINLFYAGLDQPLRQWIEDEEIPNIKLIENEPGK